jgi:hypothetical protein
VEGAQESIGLVARSLSSLSHETRAERGAKRGMRALSAPCASEAAAASSEGCWWVRTYRQEMETSTSLTRSKAPDTQGTLGLQQERWD